VQLGCLLGLGWSAGAGPSLLGPASPLRLRAASPLEAMGQSMKPCPGDLSPLRPRHHTSCRRLRCRADTLKPNLQITTPSWPRGSSAALFATVLGPASALTLRAALVPVPAFHNLLNQAWNFYPLTKMPSWPQGRSVGQVLMLGPASALRLRAAESLQASFSSPTRTVHGHRVKKRCSTITS
jgi:hypothetical protein